MGLDMYLYAERQFDAASDEAAFLASLAGSSVNGLREMAARDPMEHETYLYLSMWGHSDKDEKERAEGVIRAAGLREFCTDDAPSGHIGCANDKIAVSVPCIYWRKANAVHAWFVDRCQNGVDECQVTPVASEQLAELRSTCQAALIFFEAGDLAAAEQAMSPRSGFFFGSTDVDEYWAQDLRHTITEIERAIHLAIKVGGISFAYHSSW